MPSKRSFFNPTLFRKNLTRYWPLWGGVSIAGAFIPLYLALTLTTLQTNQRMDANEFAQVLYQSVTVFAPAFIMCYAIICAMLVWNYLYSPRAVGLMHTLPVSRTCLFITNALSGLAMLGIPFAIVGGLLCLVALVFGAFHLMAVVNTILAVVFLALLFFGLATLCAMLTGHNAVLPVLYFLFNFLAEIVEFFVSYLISQFLMGVTEENTGRLRFLSPVMNIYEKFEVASQTDYSSTSLEATYYLSGLGTVALYALAGVALLALSWLLYQKRQSERAGDIVAYAPLRPVFRYGIALLSGLTLGQLLNELFWASLYVTVDFTDLVPMMVCMAVAAVIGYYIASMLLEKSLRVFKGSLRGVLAVCAGAVILCAAASLDPMGLESRVPSLDEVERVNLYGNMDQISFGTDTEKKQKLVEQVLALHQSIVADKDYIYHTSLEQRTALPDDDEQWTFGYLYLNYVLKDGSELNRRYTLPIHRPRTEDLNTYDGKLTALLNNEAVLLASVEVPEGSLLRIDVYDTYGGEMDGNGDSEKLYQALLQDAREGHTDIGGRFPRWDDTADTCIDLGVWIEILYAQERDITVNSSAPSSAAVNSKGINLLDSMEHTIAVLIEDGYFTAEEIEALRDGTYNPD